MQSTKPTSENTNITSNTVNENYSINKITKKCQPHK